MDTCVYMYKQYNKFDIHLLNGYARKSQVKLLEKILETIYHDILIYKRHTARKVDFWPDCKAIPAYGMMVSVCLSVRPSVRPTTTFWLTFALKFWNLLNAIWPSRLYFWVRCRSAAVAFDQHHNVTDMETFFYLSTGAQVILLWGHWNTKKRISDYFQIDTPF